MLVKGIKVNVTGINDLSKNEIISYINKIENSSPKKLQYLKISSTIDGSVALDYKFSPAKFERIRRITGYLVGTTDRFNNAKRAEEHDRVKHGLN
ncbi:anaerobic ribonucleoside-triphosphate reductase [Pectinatus sottacetonis]|uniref:anaerobic ribonucleoside-triphosphate reductase n=1 Tax=Pectinatus sottacetonis TaxID=1002795 RepID=UPI0018C7BA6B|nr:anaerobic ribonucleoside-triphosphate reductase [Pectinatus sottacetonis]